MIKEEKEKITKLEKNNLFANLFKKTRKKNDKNITKCKVNEYPEPIRRISE